MKIPYKARAVLIALVVMTLIYTFVYLLKPKQNQSSLPTKGPEYNNLTPGGNNREEVLNKLGTPITEKRDGDNTTLEYKSQSNPNFNNEFLLRSDKLIFMKQYVTASDNISIVDIAKKYGSYQFVLYGSKSQNGFDLYVYPSKGIAYVGHQQAGIVIEIWYFQPTDLTNFINNFAKDYSEVPESIQ